MMACIFDKITVEGIFLLFRSFKEIYFSVYLRKPSSDIIIETFVPCLYEPIFLSGKLFVKNVDPQMEEMKVLVNVAKDRVSTILQGLFRLLKRFIWLY